MTMPEQRRTTLHVAEVVMLRSGREHLNHGIPRCGAASFPGATTTLQAAVTCARCIELLKDREVAKWTR